MSVDGLVTPEIERSNGLPPAEYWAIDQSNTIQTPVDSRGLVVVDELIPAAKQYICAEYQDWGVPDKHHLYYVSTLYRLFETLSKGSVPSNQFRELAVNKILIPRRFHNVIHKVMAPASMPEPEVMQNYIDAWTVARDLFASVRNAVNAERGRRTQKLKKGGLELPTEQEIVDQEIMEEVLKKHFGSISRHLGAMTLLPEEFRPLRLDGDVCTSVGELCDVLEHGSQRRTGAVLLPDRKDEPCSCLRCKVNSSIITSVIN